MSRLSGNNNADQVVGVWFNHGGLNAGIGCSRKVTNQWGTDLRFFTHKSQVADQHEVYERMRIDSEGNVGIGTTFPQVPFVVSNGAIRNIEMGYSSGLTNNYIQSYNRSTSTYMGLTIAANPISFQIGGTPKLQIDSSGNVLVNTTTSTSNGDRILQVGDTTRSATYVEVRTSTSGSSGILFSDGTDGSNTGYRGSIEYLHNTEFLTFKTAGTDKMSVNGTGQFFCGGIHSNTSSSAANVFVFSDGLLARSTSSIKYKTNVETLEDSYADNILNCRPVWYRSRSPLDNKDWGYWGFIAEEVAEIDPRLVNWKTTDLSHDENGAKVETPCDPEPEGVQYDRFVPHLLNLIKRQQTAIETLEASNADLLARVTALEAS